MAVELNHTIVPAHDPQASAQFLADILGLPVDPPLAHFTPVTLANGVSLDFDHYDHVYENHYAFQLSDEEFEAAFGRIRDGASRTTPTPPAASPARSMPARMADGAPISGTRTVTSWKSSPL
jgi:hypothetical protein